MTNGRSESCSSIIGRINPYILKSLGAVQQSVLLADPVHRFSSGFHHSYSLYRLSPIERCVNGIMGDSPWFLRPLQSSLPDTETIIIVAVAALLGVGIWYLGIRLQAEFRTVNAELIRAGLLLLLAGVVTVVLLIQWDATKNPLLAVGAIEFGVNTAVRVLGTVVLFIAARTATRILKRLLIADGPPHRRGLSEHQRRIAFYVGQLGIYLVAIFSTLAFWGIELSDLLLGAGILGIILGLAFQSTLGSILAGFVLILSRPFEVGDWVRIGDHEGFITEITINHVRLRNLDGEHVVLPNEGVNNRTIINRSVEGKLRQRVEVGVDYSVDPERARSTAHEAIADVDGIMNHPEPQVLLARFGDSAVILEVRFWIDDPTPQRKWQVTQAVIYAIKTEFNRKEIKIPFPQRELTTRKEDDGSRVFDSAPESTSQNPPE